MSPTTDDDERDIITRVMSRIGSLEDDARMCVQRWKEKGLDQPDNFDTAAQYLSAVVADNMRDTFNLISQHWGEFETMLWTEYIQAHFEVMTGRAHRWVLVHVNTLREPLVRDIESYQPADLDSPDSVQWKITDRLHILAEIAGVLPPLRSPEWTVRDRAYGPYMKTVTRIQKIQDALARRDREDPIEYHIADPAVFRRTTKLQLDCQQRVRREIRGEPVEPVPKEPWITELVGQMKTDAHRVGFVMYRLTYGQSDADWNAFRERLDAHLSDWGRGQTGSAALKPHLTLHWRDGKELGIPEDDIEAAKKHYLETYADSSDSPLTLVEHINQRAFLADTPSYASYKSASYAKLRSLVSGDLFGMLASRCSILEDLWPLAIDHPDQVYAGPLVPLIVKFWRIHNGTRGILMNEMTEYIKAKVEGREWPIPNPEAGKSSHQANTNTSGNTNTGTTGGNESNNAGGTPRRFLPELVPPVNPAENATHTYMMFQFARYLRRNGQAEQAIIVEQTLRTPRVELLDMDEVRRRMELEGIRPGEAWSAPPKREEGCLMQ
ncbi:hypothetical protein BDW66DRAFT_158689 [Aspergillus desertorum]